MAPTFVIMSAHYVIFVFAAALTAVATKLPPYVTVCPKSDPQVATCFMNSLNNLRPHMIKGISELEVPAIDPLELPEVKVTQVFGDLAQVLLKNVKIRGAGEFNISSINVNLEGNTFSGLIYIPNVAFEGDYNVEGNFMQLSMKGKGTIKGNATEWYGEFELRGDMEKGNGGKNFRFRKLIIHITVNKAQVSIAGLVSGDVEMGDAADDADLWLFFKPIVEETMSEVGLEMINKIAKHINVDEMFP